MPPKPKFEPTYEPLDDLRPEDVEPLPPLPQTPKDSGRIVWDGVTSFRVVKDDHDPEYTDPIT